MAVSREYFGTTSDGQAIHAYILDNGYIRARVIDYGAVLVNLCVPDKDGVRGDIVTGYDTLDRYERNPSCYGAIVGPVCNRTAGAQMEIDGAVYKMVVNDHANNLHSSKETGLFKRVWEAACGEDAVTFTLTMADGDLGLPGNRDFVVTYSLTADHGLRLHYHVASDKKTAINLTNHSYFNLDGHEAGEVYDTLLTLQCSRFTPSDAESIPTGEIRDVTGTPFDFRTEKAIGRDIDVDDLQLRQAGGYDHNLCIDGYTGSGELLPAATARSLKSGRIMKVYTSLPGVQFYTGNYLNEDNAKEGMNYRRRDAFCLETQYYPDTIHHDNFPSYLFGAGEDYDAVTEIRFATV